VLRVLKLETVREVSAGGVVLRKMRGIWHIAAIEPQTRNDDPQPNSDSPPPEPAPRKREKPPVIALPKGAVDPGEKPEQTAAREIMEETGIQARRIAKLSDIRYFYQRTWGGRERVFKVVSFFLFVYRSGKLGEIQPEMRVEVRRAMWVPLADAHRRLSYKGEREVAKLAQQYVQAHPQLENPTHR
jgi:8-oxo-dGTP pyrophosphatase MutT (NUDIX family)